MKRYDIINHLIQKHGFTSYLEIGVHQKECFDKIECDFKECIDPNFPATYEMTSDDYFRMNGQPGDIVLPYDLIFIDGLHTAEQTYKDICNAHKILSFNGFIVVHDCNPETEWHTRPESEYKRGEEWNGGTYLGFIQFKREHPDLECYTIDADYGCGIISGKPKSIDYHPLTWDYFDANRAELLQLISPDEFLAL